MLWMNVAGLGCSSITFILLLTGISTTYWFVSVGVDPYYVGLWKLCTKDECLDLDGTGFINATRGFLIISSFLLFFGMICSCLGFMKFNVGRISACLASAILEGLAALFLLIGMAIYTSKTSAVVSKGLGHLQWSFYLCWTSDVLLIISGIFQLLAHRSSPLPLPGYESV
ncbi:lens fiber membrane intrinsic protein-like [Dendropsophus ebraccatus]|uniref:lens fiber membrane intrinsic protein-like n=1 Tax=Dendropsophus ebraccatus TaxID=150705 RepID=UPI0038319253